MKAKLGIAIIILSFLGSLNPYFLLFTIPIFGLGATLLWRSSKKVGTKLIWILLPVALWFPSYLLTMSLNHQIGLATAQKFDFIFEEDFRGRAVLIGNRPCGQAVTLKNDGEQIFVPSNGVILYQGNVDLGYINHNYFRKTVSGTLEEIDLKTGLYYSNGTQASLPKDRVGVWSAGSSTKTVYTPKPSIKYKTIAFTVSSLDSLDHYKEQQYLKDFENLTDSLVRTCELATENVSNR